MSIIGSTFLDLGGNVRLDAPSNDVIDLSTYGGSTDLSTVKDCILSGSINTGTATGGHTMLVYGARNAAWTAATSISMGNGANSFDSPRIQSSGRAVAITVSVSAASTGTAAVYINGVTTGLTVSLAAALKNHAIGSVAFAADDVIQAIVTSGSFSLPRVGIFLVFD